MINSFAVIEDQFNITIDFYNCKKTDLDLRQAIINYVEKLAAQYPAPFTIYASGGIDSQALIQSFIAAKVPFKVKSIRFLNNLNIHDLENLEILSSHLGIGVEYVDFDIVNFIENDLIEHVKRYNCASPQICAHIKWTELTSEGTVVFSGSTPLRWGAEFTIDMLPFYRYSIGKNIVPFFFLQDPDVFTCFMREQKAPFWDVKNPLAQHPNWIYFNKCKLYELAGFKIFPQSQKLSGFELVKNLYDNRKDLITKWDKIKYSGRPSPRLFDLAYRYKLEEYVDYSKKRLLQLIPEEILPQGYDFERILNVDSRKT